MRQFIGFDRKIQLEWLDATAALVQAGLSTDSIAEQLDRRLAGEVVADEARRKTITVLSHVWVNVGDEYTPLRDEGLQLATQTDPAERLWVHWGMCLLVYPFFRDVAATVGKLSRLQGAFNLDQIQRRMAEQWGQRSTLHRATQRLARTFVGWNVLRDTDTRGQYEVVPPLHTTDRRLALWFLTCALRAHAAEQIPISELSQLSYLFAFDLSPFANDVRRSERFEVTRQGLDLEMVASSIPLR